MRALALELPGCRMMTVGFSMATVCLARMLGVEKLRGLALVEIRLLTGMEKWTGFTLVGVSLILTLHQLCN